MITRTNAFVSNGKTFATLEEAKLDALRTLFMRDDKEVWSAGEIASRLIDCAEQVIDVLTTTKTSKVSARKVNGGTKKRIGRKTAEEQPKNPQQL